MEADNQEGTQLDLSNPAITFVKLECKESVGSFTLVSSPDPFLMCARAFY